MEDKRFKQSITDLRRFFDEYHLREKAEIYLAYSMEYADEEEIDTVFLVFEGFALPVF